MGSSEGAVADGRYKQAGPAGGGDREMWTTILLKGQVPHDPDQLKDDTVAKAT